MLMKSQHFLNVACRSDKVVVPKLNDSNGNQVGFGPSQLGRCLGPNPITEYPNPWFEIRIYEFLRQDRSARASCVLTHRH